MERIMMNTHEATSKFIGVKALRRQRKPLTDFQFECYLLVKARTSGGIVLDDAILQVKRLLGTSTSVSRAIEQVILKGWKI